MRFLAIGAILTAMVAPTCLAAKAMTSASIFGTWKGTSTCVGNRPACKNEVVVYRLLPIDGHPQQVRWLADKIIDGKREAMGALVFDIDERAGTLRGEFQRNTTHGVWTFEIADGAMKGKLTLLPGGEVGRDVSVRRVKESEVPEAPPLSDYAE